MKQKKGNPRIPSSIPRRHSILPRGDSTIDRLLTPTVNASPPPPNPWASDQLNAPESSLGLCWQLKLAAKVERAGWLCSWISSSLRRID